MTAGIMFIFEDQDVEEAARLFETKRIRRLPVLNREKRMVGIISLGDLALNASSGLGGEALKEISGPSRAHATQEMSEVQRGLGASRDVASSRP